MNRRTISQTSKKGGLATAISMSLLLTACGGGGGGSTPPVEDNNAGVIATPATITLAEDTSGSFDVVLNTEPAADVVIAVSIADSSEATTNAGDLVFTDSAGSTPWDIAQTVTVSGVTDNAVDGNQNINIVLDSSISSDADYSALAATNVAAEVADIDTAGITIVGSNLNTSEGVSGDSFTVVLNTMPDGLVEINVASTDTSEGSANPSSLFFDSSNWNIPQTILVGPVDDLLADGNQTYDVTMTVNSGSTDTTGYSALSIPPVAVTNADNDTAGITVSTATLSTTENGALATYTVALNTMPDGDVVIDIASVDVSEGTVTPAALTFNADNWNTAQTVTVSPVDDDIADGNQTYSITLAVNAGSSTDSTGYAALTIPSVAVTNADGDTAAYTVSTATLSTAENGPTTSYTVVLNTIPDGDVELVVTSMNTSEGTVAPGTLTFDATNWSTAQTVTVSPVDDDIDDGNQAYSIVMTIGGATSDTTGYANQLLSPIAVTNADDDTAGFTVSTTSLSTVENGAPVTYTIVLNTMPNGSVLISGATDISEGTFSPALLTFNQINWNTPKTITVTPVDDDIADGNQSYDVAMAVDGVNSSDTTGYTSLSIPSVAVINADDDTAGFTVSIADVTTTEGGAPVLYTIVLNTQPDGDVVLDVMSNDETEGFVTPSALTFTSVDWETAQQVILAPLNDVEVDGTVAYTVVTSINVSTADGTGYLSLPPHVLSVSNDDDDDTVLSPAVLAFGTADLPHAGTVDTTMSYYEVTGLTSGDSYDISASGMSADVDLYVYLTDSSYLIWDCRPWTSGPIDETCTVTAAGTSVWIAIDGQYTGGLGATFTLDVVTAAPPPVAEGSVLTPVALAFGTADLPRAATVDTTWSYYEVTGLTSGDSYDVIASSMSADVDLYVYLSDSSYGSDDCASAGLGDETCTVTATGTSMWVAIDGAFTGGAGATFELDVVTAAPPAALVAEGSVLTPVALAFGTADLPRSATVDTTFSYYEVTGLTSGTSYTASVTGVSDDVDIYVYLTDSSYGASTWDCRPYSIGTVDEACTGMVAAGTSMWVAVDGQFTQGGATFTLDVQ